MSRRTNQSVSASMRDLTTGVQDEREYSSRIERTGGAVKQSGARHRIIHDEERRHRAFTGSDLELILRAKNIDHLVLTGISTSGVVLSTLREAVDKDYILTVLSDLCADRDEEVHRVLTEKVFPRHADVLSSTAWLSTLRSVE